MNHLNHTQKSFEFSNSFKKEWIVSNKKIVFSDCGKNWLGLGVICLNKNFLSSPSNIKSLKDNLKKIFTTVFRKVKSNPVSLLICGQPAIISFILVVFYGWGIATVCCSTCNCFQESPGSYHFIKKDNTNEFLTTLFEYEIFLENCLLDGFKSFMKLMSETRRKK